MSLSVLTMLMGVSIHYAGGRMWTNTVEEAHDFSQVVLTVLPIFALSRLIQNRDVFRPGTRQPDGPLPSEERPTLATTHAIGGVDNSALDSELSALRKALYFYVGFVASSALALVGLLSTPSSSLLAVEFFTFALTVYVLFANIGDQLVADLLTVYRCSGGQQLYWIPPVSRLVSLRIGMRLTKEFWVIRDSRG